MFQTQKRLVKRLLRRKIRKEKGECARCTNSCINWPQKCFGQSFQAEKAKRANAVSIMNSAWMPNRENHTVHLNGHNSMNFSPMSLKIRSTESKLKNNVNLLNQLIIQHVANET